MNVVPIRRAQIGRVVPPLVKQAMPTVRDRRPLSAQLSQMTPEKLAAVLMQAENGQMSAYQDLCDRMCETDGEIRADYETRISAVAGSRMQFEAGRSGDPARDAYAADAAAFVENVTNSVKDFDQAVQDLLDGIGKAYAAVQREWVWDGAGNAFVVKAFHWVHQRRFTWGREFDLRLIDDGQQISALGWELDPDLWIVHAPRTLSGYPTRGGCMRACTWAWLFKRWGWQFWVSGAERFAWPFFFAKVPRGSDDDVRKKALEQLEQLSNDHAGVIEDPAVFQMVETTVKDGGTYKDLCAGLNGEIAKTILGMTDLSGPGKVGAYGAVEARRGATVSPRIAIDERQIRGTMTGQYCEALIRFNAHRWPVLPPTPVARWIVATSRTEISTEAMPAARVNEVRASQDLDPLPEPIGSMLWRDFNPDKSAAAPTPGGATPSAATVASVADTAFNGAQLVAIGGYIDQVVAGALPKESAIALVLLGFPDSNEARVRAVFDPIVVRTAPALPSGGGATDALPKPPSQSGDRGTP